jgi:hypothetical protein
LPEVNDENESPVPGKPTVCLVPRLLRLMLAPGAPTEVLTPDLLRLMRMPGRIFIDLRNRNAISNASQ